MIAETCRAEVFTPEIRELGERLLHHQCWFFGRDIWHGRGNLLIRYGFERFAPTEKEKGSNLYRWREAGNEINLWGWGVFYGNETGGILIKRYDFRPRLLGVGKLRVPVFKSENLPPSRVPRKDFQIENARNLTLDFIHWIVRYEDWIEQTCGTRWRGKCLRDWQNAVLKKREIRKQWNFLQNELKKI